ncbi:lipoate-protein ligase B [Xylanimonas cellulosilytica DSM 15894]|uniref:Octanoyltransferase n=1 Tax=Xylanimonas cellulosilytica (strain DSM 15894 / JCM 12276 / CECT 5975 / KCTC 9989 / LMG 20990 / NBRC 107835 / XIL07) TaxID=446471 RepID=D1BTS4_XYLCX|nr:lipoyl(octanoyl) transferase LipB [Xylanimonas cellulosilytica]ACZ31053.1 lipoate-protein ligase B [Xylanimonas cellulosilytica DSM 15894]
MGTPLIEIEHLPGRVDYHAGWELQRRTHAAVSEGLRGPVAYLLEHDGVYTAGRRTRRDEYPTDGTPVVDVDRGGKITWHGPGQIVAYPIARLVSPVDVVQYVRTLEAAVIDVCARLGVETIRVEGRSGVWLPADAAPDGDAAHTGARRERKICAIGARVARGVTMHGLALNCDADLAAFGRIVPCGIDDADVTSLSAELGRDVTVAEVRPLLADALRRYLAPLVTEVTATGQDEAPRVAEAAVV